MSSIKHTSKAIHGEIAATLTVFAMMVMTLGVLFGASLINQGTPQTQTEAFANNGNISEIVNDKASIFSIGSPTTRDSTTPQEIVQVELCFRSNPSSQGRYKLAVYTTSDSTFRTWDARNNIGQAIEKNVSAPSTLRCGTGSERMNIVYEKAPDRPSAGTGSGTGPRSGSGTGGPATGSSTAPGQGSSGTGGGTGGTGGSSGTGSGSSLPATPTPSDAPPIIGGNPGGGQQPPVVNTPTPQNSFNFDEFQGAVIVLETTNMDFTDIVVGKIAAAQFDPPVGGTGGSGGTGGTGGSGGTGSGSTLPATPTATPTLPPLDRCYGNCQTNIPSGSADTCGVGFTCKDTRTAGGSCDAATNNCKCLPTGKESCVDFNCACAGRAMCDARIVISGQLDISTGGVVGDIPQDSSGNKYLFKVHACKTETSSGTGTPRIQCKPSSEFYGSTLVGSDLRFSFRGLAHEDPAQMMGVYLDPKMYKSDGSEAGVNVPNYSSVEVVGCTSNNTKGIEGVLDANKQYCYIKIYSIPNTACTVEGVNFKAPIPTFSPTPVPSAIPSPTPRSEADRTIKLQVILHNKTSLTLSRPPGREPQCSNGKCYVKRECDPTTGVCKFVYGPGLTIKSMKYKICAVMPSGDNSNCSNIITLDGLNLGPVKEDNQNGNPLRKDAPNYILPPYADPIPLFSNCTVQFTDNTEIDCNLKPPSGTDPIPTPTGTGNRRSTGSTNSSGQFYVALSLYSKADSGVYPLPLFKSQTEATDVSGNNCINVDDYSRIVLAYGKSTDDIASSPQQGESAFEGVDLPEDVNFDGVVNAFDMAIILSSFGQGDNCAFNQP